jgi:hypothetical protein
LSQFSGVFPAFYFEVLVEFFDLGVWLLHCAAKG